MEQNMGLLETKIWILLFLQLISSVPAATFVVNVTQSSYQAEEKHNITLEWTFTTKPDSSSTYLSIYCDLRTDVGFEPLFDVLNGVEVSLTQNDQFSGRVQSDKDALREGRIRLHVSRLRTEDSGQYRCQVNTDYGWSSASCHLSITAAELQPQRPTLIPQPETGEKIINYFSIAVAATLTLFISVGAFISLKKNIEKKKQHVSENEPLKEHVPFPGMKTQTFISVVSQTSSSEQLMEQLVVGGK